MDLRRLLGLVASKNGGLSRPLPKGSHFGQAPNAWPGIQEGIKSGALRVEPPALQVKPLFHPSLGTDRPSEPLQGNPGAPGYTPLQGSSGRKLQAGRTQWQNTDGKRRNTVNPQVKDLGYYWNQ